MERIEVYKTDVDDRLKAETILDEIRRRFPGSDPSIDLDDCDKVLRIEGSLNGVDELKVREILRDQGYKMETLP
jgi:hypothetical protein